jgi:hypothetical protein
MLNANAFRTASAAAVIGLAAVCAALPAPALAQPMLTADQLLREPAFEEAYRAALGPHARTKWLARLEMSAPIANVKAGGETWQMATPCKPHDCADNNLLLLWSPARKTVVGKLVEGGRAKLLGAPDAAMASDLDRLWQKEFRQR